MTSCYEQCENIFLSDKVSYRQSFPDESAELNSLYYNVNKNEHICHRCKNIVNTLLLSFDSSAELKYSGCKGEQYHYTGSLLTRSGSLVPLRKTKETVYETLQYISDIVEEDEKNCSICKQVLLNVINRRKTRSGQKIDSYHTEGIYFDTDCRFKTNFEQTINLFRSSNVEIIEDFIEDKYRYTKGQIGDRNDNVKIYNRLQEFVKSEPANIQFRRTIKIQFGNSSVSFPVYSDKDYRDISELFDPVNTEHLNEDIILSSGIHTEQEKYVNINDRHMIAIIEEIEFTDSSKKWPDNRVFLFK